MIDEDILALDVAGLHRKVMEQRRYIDIIARLFRTLNDLEEEARAAVRSGEPDMMLRVCEDVIVATADACTVVGPCDECRRQP